LQVGSAARATIQKAERALAKAAKKVEHAIADLARAGNASEKTIGEADVPERRTRKERTFPTVVPADRIFAFLWPAADPAAHRVALQQLCERVTRLGHSSSLVRCVISSRTWSPTLEPRTDGSHQLRVAGPGQLRRLDDEFVRHQGVELRTLPFTPQQYGSPGPLLRSSSPQGAFSDADRWIVFEWVGGARLLSSRGVALARVVRAAMLEQADELGIALPEALSGHAGGRPSESPHLAIVPLAFVGSRYADASIQAVAIVPPVDLTVENRNILVRLIAALELARSEGDVLTFSAPGLPPTRYQRVPNPTKRSSQPATWCRQSVRFVTATPIALDRNPGNLRSNVAGIAHRAAIAAQGVIAAACELQHLPRPVRVEIGFSPFASGAQNARDFGARTKRNDLARVRVHADIEFASPVRGPLLLGATRYFGGGLCLPVGPSGSQGEGP
jgi:CRISPR-associated protein Csb2